MQNSKTQQCDKIQNVVYEMVGRFGSPLECVEPSIAEEDMEDPEAGRMTILMRNSRKLCKLSEAEMALALAVFEEEDFAQLVSELPATEQFHCRKLKGKLREAVSEKEGMKAEIEWLKYQLNNAKEDLFELTADKKEAL